MSEMQKERMEVLKDGLPLRLKKVIMLNAPWWMSILLAISKPFMGEKMRSRLHSVDNKGLVEHLDEQLIPQDLRHVSKSERKALKKQNKNNDNSTSNSNSSSNNNETSEQTGKNVEEDAEEEALKREMAAQQFD